MQGIDLDFVGVCLQYIYGIAFIRKHPRFDEAVLSLFSFFNKNRDKNLSLESVSTGLLSLYPGIQTSQVCSSHRKAADTFPSQFDLR